MSIAQLDTIKGGNIINPFRQFTGGEASEQPVGGGGICYSDTPTSCIHCV